mmetsp:Transcript_3636/g.15136  ORF Transcript_3636/g.15136 Transcript_3636/m.15136 type:complete len:265 (-) Transcript_3636:315-1109(-)
MEASERVGARGREDCLAGGVLNCIGTAGAETSTGVASVSLAESASEPAPAPAPAPVPAPPPLPQPAPSPPEADAVSSEGLEEAVALLGFTGERPAPVVPGLRAGAAGRRGTRSAFGRSTKKKVTSSQPVRVLVAATAAATIAPGLASAVSRRVTARAQAPCTSARAASLARRQRCSAADVARAAALRAAAVAGAEGDAGLHTSSTPTRTLAPEAAAAKRGAAMSDRTAFAPRWGWGGLAWAVAASAALGGGGACQEASVRDRTA